MAGPPLPPLDDRLARLGRAWFAEVRRDDAAETRRERERERRRDGDGAVSDGIVDWLFGDGDGSGSDDGGGGTAD